MAKKKKKKAVKKRRPVLKKKKAVKRKAIKKKVIRKKVAKKSIKRKPAKKALKKKAPVKKTAAQKAKEGVIGEVTHYFPHVRAAVIKLSAPLVIGTTIKIKGHTTDFTQKVSSMQVDHVPISEAKKGDEIGLLVSSRVRRKDDVYKL